MVGITDLTKDVAKELGVSQAVAKEAIEAVFGAISDRLNNREDVALRGFGAFKIKQTAARTGRNPRTGEAVQIPAREKVVFKASK